MLMRSHFTIRLIILVLHINDGLNYILLFVRETDTIIKIFDCSTGEWSKCEGERYLKNGLR